jgi:hypothetical protein
MNFRIFIALAPFSALMLGACADPGSFPSLAPRPYEKGGAVPAAPVETIKPSDPALLDRLNAAVARAEAGQGAYATALASARSATAAGAGQSGSEAWIEAQMAVSRLERTREAAQGALADLDQEKRVMLFGPPSADLPAMEAAMARVSAIDGEQLAAVTALVRRLQGR